MSKITQALEKAARERLKKLEDRPTAPAAPVAVALAPTVGVGNIAPIGQITIDPHLVSITDSKSPIAEQYRMLKANLQSQRGRANVKTIVVTSAMHEEGKSITSLNLALTLARDEQLRVVLVDGDMRKSSVNHWLGMGLPKSGLSTALQDGGAVNGSLVKLQSPPLTILPSGPAPDDPAALLESGAMRRLLASLKAQFDLVIIDAPPVLAVADPGIIAAQADGAILVVRAGHTQRRAILQAQNRLRQVKADLFGCVLTHAEDLPGYARYYRYYHKEKEKQRHAGSAPAISAN